jgi:hypothetical protein
MARTKRPQQLPRLPPVSTLRRTEAEGEGLLDLLRRVAEAAQSLQSRPFYSLRDIAKQYQLPLSRVARVYRRLEAEGILSRIRGSRTILQGSGPTRHLTVRHVVGMPAALSCFITLQDYRSFFIKARREFRRRDLITAIAFYEHRDEALAQRLREAHADLVVWYLPDGMARLAAPRLQDWGIRILGINDGGLPSLPCRYEIRREMAIRSILSDWTATGIRRVRVARFKAHSSADEERLADLLSEAPFDSEFLEPNTDSTERFLDGLASEKNQGVIFLARAASLFLMRAPGAFYNLVRKSRVALLDGPVSMPFTGRAAARVDLVVVDWQRVAQRLTDDILSREAFVDGAPVLFEAKAEINGLLDRFAQNI